MSKRPEAFMILTSENHGAPNIQWQNMTYGEIIALLEIVKLDMLMKLRGTGQKTQIHTNIDERIGKGIQ